MMSPFGRGKVVNIWQDSSVKDFMDCQNVGKQILGAEKEKYLHSLDTQWSFISFDTFLLY